MMFLSSDSVYKIGLENAFTSSAKENLNFKSNYSLQCSLCKYLPSPLLVHTMRLNWVGDIRVHSWGSAVRAVHI